MNNYAKQIQNELENCGKMPIFEIRVKNNETQEVDYISCDIFVRRNSLVAQRDGVSVSEQRSKFIAETTHVIENGFSLDEQLHELHSKIQEDIEAGDLFSLSFE